MEALCSISDKARNRARVGAVETVLAVGAEEFAAPGQQHQGPGGGHAHGGGQEAAACECGQIVGAQGFALAHGQALAKHQEHPLENH